MRERTKAANLFSKLVRYYIDDHRLALVWLTHTDIV